MSNGTETDNQTGTGGGNTAGAAGTQGSPTPGDNNNRTGRSSNNNDGRNPNNNKEHDTNNSSIKGFKGEEAKLPILGTSVEQRGLADRYGNFIRKLRGFVTNSTNNYDHPEDLLPLKGAQKSLEETIEGSL